MMVASGGTDIVQTPSVIAGEAAGGESATTSGHEVQAQASGPMRMEEIRAEMTTAALLSQQCRGCNHETNCGCIRSSSGAESNRQQASIAAHRPADRAPRLRAATCSPELDPCRSPAEAAARSLRGRGPR